jgi:hypothetical protein
MPAPIGAVTEEGRMHVLRVNGYDMAYVEHGLGPRCS